MQQVALILQGERDYALVAGDTGPLVYPAGHVWVFSALSALTAERVSRAQLVFLGLYLVLIGVVLRIYRNTSVPSFVFPVLILSRRIHSIFMLRLFNDCWAMTVCWLAIWCFCLDRWTIGCLLYSFAVSIKMNILLFAPGLFVLLLRRFGAWKTVIKISLCALVQLVLGFPFLSQFPKNYIKNSFDLGRVFMYKWTVNWKILPEDIFVSKSLAVSLLVLHIVLVALFAWKKWIPLLFSKDKERTIPKESILYVLFTSNLIGIACARSLHFQFYVWYFHSLPFLLWKTSFFGPTVVQHLERILLLFCIEVVWNVFPSRAWTSALLQVCHGILLIALWRDNNRAKATKALKTE
jgi:alpha-1,3-mannosyltransferase